MRSRVMRGIRPIDAVLAVMNIESTDGSTRIDSHSWLQLPLFVAAMLPVLWWRRSLLGALLASSGLMLVHVLAFGHGVRCGAGLPLAFVLAFLCGLASVPQRERRTAVVLSVVLATDLPCNVDHGIIGLMDPAHGPFVHQAWWWRSARGWSSSYANATRTSGRCATNVPRWR